jgi:hypothetical protein
VSASSFKIQTDIRYRNSFLPVIPGRVIPASTGSRIEVIRHLHPLVALLTAVFIWLGVRGHVLLKKASAFGLPAGAIFFLFLAIFVASGFFPEAWQAKRLISTTILNEEERQKSIPAL